MLIRRVACLLVLLLAACSNPTPPPPRVAAWVGEQSNLLFLRVLSADVLNDARLTAPGGEIILTRRLSTSGQSCVHGDAGDSGVGPTGVACIRARTGGGWGKEVAS